MSGGIGQGLPWWLPDAFLNVDETLALGEADLDLKDRVCPKCLAEGAASMTIMARQRFGLDPAHIVNKGMGGRPKGSGPTVRLCRHHHDLQHFSADGIQRCMAIRKTDGAICWLEYEGCTPLREPVITITVLGFKHPWEWDE